MNDNPNKIPGKYRVNFGDDYKSRIAEQVVNEWVLRWTKRYHPEAFTEARSEVYNRLDMPAPQDINEKTTK
jgi:hypothetical protein